MGSGYSSLLEGHVGTALNWNLWTRWVPVSEDSVVTACGYRLPICAASLGLVWLHYPSDPSFLTLTPFLTLTSHKYFLLSLEHSYQTSFSGLWKLLTLLKCPHSSCPHYLQVFIQMSLFQWAFSAWIFSILTALTESIISYPPSLLAFLIYTLCIYVYIYIYVFMYTYTYISILKYSSLLHYKTQEEKDFSTFWSLLPSPERSAQVW